MSEHDDFMAVPDGNHAEEQLRRAAESGRRASTASWRWVRIYLGGWAAASVALVLLLGIGARGVMIAGFVAWAVIVAIGAWWSATRRLAPAGARARIGRAAALWAVAYAVVIALGSSTEASWGFWIAGAAVTAVPPLAGVFAPQPKAPEHA